MRISRLGLVSAALVSTCAADAFSEAAALLPACGLQCVLSELPKSVCQLTDSACICTNAPLAELLQACVLATCKPTDAIAMARVQAGACGFPVRSRKTDLWGVLAIEVIALVCLSLRLYSRWTVSKFELDDYIMALVAVLFVVFAGLGRYAGILAFGKDIWTVSAENITQAIKIFYADEAIYLVLLSLTKISLLCFYLRIFPQPAFRLAVHATLGCIVLSGLVILFLQIFQCTPVRFIWEGWAGDFGGPHRCLDVNLLAWVAGGVSIAQDVVILALPLPLLYHLQASRRAKAGVLFMFSLGIFICITSCVRLRFLVIFAKSANPTWDYTDPMLWSSIEVCVSIIVTSLPAIRVLLSRLRPGLFGTRNGKSHPGSRATGTEPGSLAGPDKSAGAGRSAQSRIFSIMARGDSPDSSESQLELGVRGAPDAAAARTEVVFADDKSQRTVSVSRRKRSRSRSKGPGRGKNKPLPGTPDPPDPNGPLSGIHVVRTYSLTTTRVVIDRGRPPNQQ